MKAKSLFETWREGNSVSKEPDQIGSDSSRKPPKPKTARGKIKEPKPAVSQPPISSEPALIPETSRYNLRPSASTSSESDDSRRVLRSSKK